MLEFMAIMRGTQSVRIADVEALDKVYASKLSADLWRILRAIQREIFQHLQASSPAFFDSVEFVMVVTLDKLLASPGVKNYYGRLAFLENVVAQNNIIRWNHAQSKDMTYISCRKRLGQETTKQLPNQLRDFFVQFAPDTRAQLRSLRRMRPSSCEIKDDDSLALLLCKIPLHILVQALFLLLGGKSLVITSHSLAHLQKLIRAMPLLMLPFNISKTHQTVYFYTTSEFAAWIDQQDLHQTWLGQSAYLIGASHEALSGLIPEDKRKLIALFSRAHLQSNSSDKEGAIFQDPLSTFYLGDFPDADNNIGVLDLDLGDIYFHHGNETVSDFVNVRSENADILTNAFSVRKFESYAFAALRGDICAQKEAMDKVISCGTEATKMYKVVVERSNRLVELAFARYLSNVVLRFLPSHLYFYAQYSVAICDVKAILADILECHHQSSGQEMCKDSVSITHSLSDLETGFSIDLVSGSRPSLVTLINDAGITAFKVIVV